MGFPGFRLYLAKRDDYCCTPFGLSWGSVGLEVHKAQIFGDLPCFNFGRFLFSEVVFLEQEGQHRVSGVMLGYFVHGIAKPVAEAIDVFTIDCGTWVGLYTFLVYISDPDTATWRGW